MELRFRTNVRHYRILRGFSQGVLAKELGIGRTTVTNWEAGLAAPDLETAVKLAKQLDITLDMLVVSRPVNNPDQPISLADFENALAGLSQLYIELIKCRQAN